MSRDPKLLRALVSTRNRMRDLAAAEHAVRDGACTVAATAVANETTHLDVLLDGAGHILGRALSIYDLDRVAHDVAAQRATIAHARQHHVEARAIADLAASALRDRTRQLRTAEKLVEISRDERASTESRAEQRGADDMTASRGR